MGVWVVSVDREVGTFHVVGECAANMVNCEVAYTFVRWLRDGGELTSCCRGH